MEKEKPTGAASPLKYGIATLDPGPKSEPASAGMTPWQTPDAPTVALPEALY